jgi:hypothetical protein
MLRKIPGTALLFPQLVVFSGSSDLARNLLILKRKWWNWQTHHLEGVAPQGVGVQIPPSAPETPLESIVYKHVFGFVQ